MTTDGLLTSLPATHAKAAAPAADLPADLVTCHAIIRQLLDSRMEDARLIEGLQHQLNNLLRRAYGRSSEKLDPNQLALFEKMLAELANAVPPAPAVEPAATSATPAKTNGHGRRQLPAELERRPVILDLPEEEKLCPCCHVMRQPMGEEITEKLDFEPARVFVRQEIRRKYVCRACESSAAETGPQIVIAEKPLSPIEKGLAAPGLLAHIIVSKYADHQPLHRLERILDRHDIQISRSTTCDWMAACACVLKPLYNIMVTAVLAFRRHRSQPVRGIINEINPILQGWVNYFRIGNSSECFSYVRHWVERKTVRHMARARKRRGAGWEGWSIQRLHAELGLFNDYEIRYWRPPAKVPQPDGSHNP